MFNLIVSQGRIADRNNGMINGAKLTAKRIIDKYSIDATFLGIRSFAKIDHWVESLAEAKNNLLLIQDAFKKSIQSEMKTVLVSNTCSASLATLPIIADYNMDTVILWIDAHGDFNTPNTSSSGYLGGMVLSAASGLWNSGFGSGVNPSQLVLVGARDIDEQEFELINNSQVCVIPPSNDIVDKVLNKIGLSPVYIHIDWDVMEPGYLHADYSVPNGLVPDQIRSLFTSLSIKNNIVGLEIAEFVPSYNEEIDNMSLNTIMYMIEPIIDNLNVVN